MSLAEFAKHDIPVLQPGDRLNRAESERRYHAMPDCKKAELIEGVVYVSSSAKLRHGQTHGLLITWIGNYADATPGTDYADNATNRLDIDNEPQPDVALFIEAERGGQSRVSEDGYLTGPVEFVAEVSVSSVLARSRAKVENLRTTWSSRVFDLASRRQSDRMVHAGRLRLRVASVTRRRHLSQPSFSRFVARRRSHAQTRWPSRHASS